jgi:hypothetical protein
VWRPLVLTQMILLKVALKHQKINIFIYIYIYMINSRIWFWPVNPHFHFEDCSLPLRCGLLCNIISFVLFFYSFLYKIPEVCRNKSASSETQFVPVGIPIVCWNIRAPNWTIMLSKKIMVEWSRPDNIHKTLLDFEWLCIKQDLSLYIASNNKILIPLFSIPL